MATRLNPTLFDKLVGGLEVDGLIDSSSGGDGESSRDTMRNYSVPRLERFNEEALRATVRRELAWLLNTTQLGAVVDLTAYPEVQTSVLNYGVPDLAGKALARRVILQRARDIRAAVRIFEPRIDESSLIVEPAENRERENATTFIIHGDVRSAVRALPVQFRTDVEADTAAVVVRD
jgi:type VI secretion system protein ImpF